MKNHLAKKLWKGFLEMKQVLYTLFMMISFFGSLFGDTYPRFASPEVELIYKGAQPKIALVFMAEGYRRHEIPRFKSDTKSMTNAIFSEPMYQPYAKFLQIYRVNTISMNSGVDPSPTSKILDTAFNSNMKTGRGMWAEHYRIVGIAKKVKTTLPIYSIVLANTNAFGGMAYHTLKWCILTAHNSGSRNILNHELGHLLFNLGDEYGTDNNSWKKYKGGEPIYPNLSLEGKRKKVKWTKILRKTWEGGMGYDIGIWHGEYDCKMHFNSSPFCRVCQYYIRQFFQNLPTPITKPTVILTSPIQDKTIYKNWIKVTWKKYLLEDCSRVLRFTWQNKSESKTLEKGKDYFDWTIPDGWEGKFMVEITYYDSTGKQVAQDQKSFYHYLKPDLELTSPIQGVRVEKNQIFVKWSEINIKKGSIALHISPNLGSSFYLLSMFNSYFNKGKMTNSILREFKKKGLALSRQTHISTLVKNQSWQFHHQGQIYEIKHENKRLKVSQKLSPISITLPVKQKKYLLNIPSRWKGKITINLDYTNFFGKKEVSISSYFYYKTNLSRGMASGLSSNKKLGIIRQIRKASQK